MFRRDKTPEPVVDQAFLDLRLEEIQNDDSVPEHEKLPARLALIAATYDPVIAYHRAGSEKWGRRADQMRRVNVYIYAGLSVFYTIMAIGYLMANRWGYGILWVLLAAGWGYLSVWTKRFLKQKAEDA